MSASYRDQAGERLTILAAEHGEEPCWQVRTVDALTGATIWKALLPNDGEVGDPAIHNASMLIARGRVVVVDGLGKVYCMELESGRALWSAALERRVVPGFFGGAGEVSMSGSPSILLELEQGPFIAYEDSVAAFGWDGKMLWSEAGASAGALGTPRGVAHRDET